MKLRVRHIALILLVISALAACSGRAKKIPKSKMADIYAEILVTDQWISNNYSYRKLADTSLVYAPILRKYGYTVEDYMYSVELYMNDSERFSRILRTTAERLDKRLVKLQAEKDRLDRIKYNKETYAFDFHSENDFPYIREIPDYFDTLRVEIDTLTMAYELVQEILNDTIFRGPGFIVREKLLPDSLELVRLDSLARVDSLAKVLADSLARVDSLAKVKADSLVRVARADSLKREGLKDERLGRHSGMRERVLRNTELESGKIRN